MKQWVVQKAANVELKSKFPMTTTMKNRDRLIDAICTTYDKCWIDDHPYASLDGETFCNMAVQDVARSMGCKELDGRMANEIYEYISAAKTWSTIPMVDAQLLANGGSFVLAAQRGDHHGHVCVVRPGTAKWSAKWNCSVPSIMNVGQRNFISLGVNWAFMTEPNFYVWKDSL